MAGGFRPTTLSFFSSIATVSHKEAYFTFDNPGGIGKLSLYDYKDKLVKYWPGNNTTKERDPFKYDGGGPIPPSPPSGWKIEAPQYSSQYMSEQDKRRFGVPHYPFIPITTSGTGRTDIGIHGIRSGFSFQSKTLGCIRVSNQDAFTLVALIHNFKLQGEPINVIHVPGKS